MARSRTALPKLYVRSKEKGTFYFTMTVGYDDDGKQIQQKKTVYGPTKREATARQLELLNEVKQDRHVEPGRVTVQGFLEGWLETHGQLNITAKSYDQYEGDLRRHVYPRLGKVLLVKLRAEQLEALYAELRTMGGVKRQGIAASTVARIHRVLHKGFAVAVQRRQMARNPCDDIKAPRVPERELEVYERDQVIQLLRKTTESVVHLPVAFALLTGMRRGEILALRWEDVNLDAQRIAVRRSLSQTRKEGLVFKAPKNGKGRVLPLTTGLVQILRRHREEQDRRRQELGAEWQEHGLVFPNPNGTPRPPDNFSHTWRQFILKSGLPVKRFHDLRHTHCSLLLNDGVPVKNASAHMGHSGIGITADLYGHLFQSAQDEIRSRIEGMSLLDVPADNA